MLAKGRRPVREREHIIKAKNLNARCRSDASFLM